MAFLNTIPVVPTESKPRVLDLYELYRASNHESFVWILCKYVLTNEIMQMLVFALNIGDSKRLWQCVVDFYDLAPTGVRYWKHAAQLFALECMLYSNLKPLYSYFTASNGYRRHRLRWPIDWVLPSNAKSLHWVSYQRCQTSSISKCNGSRLCQIDLHVNYMKLFFGSLLYPYEQKAMFNKDVPTRKRPPYTVG